MPPMHIGEQRRLKSMVMANKDVQAVMARPTVQGVETASGD
jgi:hypothetical protein